MNFNPRLHPLDIVLVVAAIAVFGRLMPFVVRAVAPDADHMALGIRAAFAIALGTLALRMKIFPVELPEHREVSPARRMTSILLFAVGGTVAVLACLVIVLRVSSGDAYTMADLQ